MKMTISSVVSFDGPNSEQRDQIRKMARAIGCRVIESDEGIRVIFDDHARFQAFMDHVGDLFNL